MDTAPAPRVARTTVRFTAPLLVFVLLLVLLLAGLRLNPREVPSALIGMPAPGFSLARLDRPEQMFTHESMRGQVWLLNVWASWCTACREEHPLLLEMARARDVTLIGLNYRDKADDAARWLQQYGDPYQVSIFDGDGRVGLDYGVYGVPETYVIDRAGVVRFKQTGPLRAETLNKRILPLIRTLQQ